jgi:serine/threonine protein kinase
LDKEFNVKLGDFGLATHHHYKLTDENFPHPKLLKFKSSCTTEETKELTMGIGTPIYMAPEQKNNPVFKSGRYNYLADMYSLGLIFFELQCGGFYTFSEMESAFTYLKEKN